jgi:hypothetical protein
MEVVLDEVFEGVPHGGDHESRKYVAKELMQSARKGNVTLDGLRAVGRDAFRQLSGGASFGDGANRIVADMTFGISDKSIELADSLPQQITSDPRRFVRSTIEDGLSTQSSRS